MYSDICEGAIKMQESEKRVQGCWEGSRVVDVWWGWAMCKMPGHVEKARCFWRLKVQGRIEIIIIIKFLEKKGFQMFDGSADTVLRYLKFFRIKPLRSWKISI